jgi:hypothetical protein
VSSRSGREAHQQFGFLIDGRCAQSSGEAHDLGEIADQVPLSGRERHPKQNGLQDGCRRRHGRSQSVDLKDLHPLRQALLTSGALTPIGDGLGLCAGTRMCRWWQVLDGVAKE